MLSVTRNSLLRRTLQRRAGRSTLAWLAALVLCLCAVAHGQEPPERMERTLYVPFSDLSLILNGPNERVFMTVDEYRELVAEAAKKPPTRAPRSTVVVKADYQVEVQENIATIRGKMEVEVLNPGLHIVPLTFQGITLRDAKLDDATAPIARGPNNQLLLFVRGAGRHQLEVELQTPVVVAAAQQSMQFRVPQAGSTALQVDVPGNVELKSGSSVVQRNYDPQSDQTHFDLLPDSNVMSLIMSLNNRRLRQGRVVAARSVLVSELTTSYERLHVTAEMRILHGAVDQFQFEVPSGFQVTGVDSPLLAQWVLRSEEEREILEVTLRQATRATETLSISASRAPVTIGQWTMPQLKPLDVAGHVAVVGLVAESRLRPLGMTAENLIHLDTSVLREALPASVFDNEPGAPAIRQIAAYYAPSDQFKLSATLEDPKDELRVATHMLLTLDEQQQSLRGGFTLTPQASKLTTFAFQLPADWQLDQLHGADQQPLQFDRYQTDDHWRFLVKLPQTIPPGTSQTVFFVASHRSSAWLTQWESQQVAFPRVVVEQATDTSGAIAVQASSDLTAKPVTTDGLVPIDSKERSRFGLADSSTELTYEVTGDTYEAEFLVERKQPKISSRNYSFFQVDDGVLLARHEVVFWIERARANRLELSLPDTTPTALRIHGLDGVQLKEYSHVNEDGENRWTVLLAKPRMEQVRLAIDYQQRLDDAEPADFPLPLVRTVGVSYQTQMAAIEGDPSLDIAVRTDMRRVDVGELAEADYTPGSRLLGAYASTADDEGIQIDVTRRELKPLPAALVRRAELVTLVASSGVSQSSARYILQTKVPYLALELPPDTELWSVTLNQKPIKPRRRGDQVLVSLQTGSAGGDRDLQVVYQTIVDKLDWLGNVRTSAPQLRLLLNEEDQGAVVPQVDLVWHLLLPTGYNISRVRGTVFTSDVPPPETPLKALAKAAAVAGGGRQLSPVMLASRRARELAQSRADYRVMADSAAIEETSPEMAAGSEAMDISNFEFAGQSEGESREAAPDAAETPAPPARPAVRAPTNQPQSSAGQSADPFAQSARNGAQPGMGGGGMGGMPGQPGTDKGGSQLGMGMGMSGGGYGAGFGSQSGEEGAYGGYEGGEQTLRYGQGGQIRPGRQDANANGDTQGGRFSLGQRRRRSEISGPAVAQGAMPADAAPQQGVPATPTTQADVAVGKYWALQGLRGLAIKIDRTGDEITFRSLGSEPLLDITVFQESRMNWLALSAALTVLVLGLLLARRSVAARIRFVVLLAILACGLPLFGGLTTEFATVFEYSLLATLALIPIWVFLAVITRTWRWFSGRFSPERAAASALILLACAMGTGGSVAQAQDITELLRPLIEEGQPVRIPEDAVVIPYDPADEQWRENATKVLVPYQRYTELWNQAHPDKKIGPAAPKQQFAFAGARYEAALAAEEQIVLTGTVEIEVFSDEPVDVPLALRDGIITSAQLDGQPARLKTIIPQPSPNQQPAQRQQAEAPAASMLALLVEGKGRHQLELAVRVAVTRQGGWRIARATVPYAPAKSLDLIVPEAETTVRRRLGQTVFSDTTTDPNQVIRSTLLAGGVFDVTWRAKISPGSIDQALTASSAALVDVREDGIRVIWKTTLTFGQTERGTFRLEVPSDYLVEKVDGKNVRGWDTVQDADRTIMTVELLKAVRQQEEMVVHLARRAAFTSSEASSFVAPVVAVPDAALHRGTVQIRRSPILELQTGATAGVTRTDGAEVTKALEPLLAGQKSPLGVREYQAYQFNTTPFRIEMEAFEVQPRVTARLRTIFRIGETESALESEIRLSPQRRAIYQVEVAIPAELELKKVSAPGLTDWSRIEDPERPMLRAFFADGMAQTFALSIEGKLSEHAADEALDLPHLEVLGVQSQNGHMVVQVDPSLDARTSGLEGCQEVTLESVTNWLNNEQRPLARLGLGYSGTSYSGKIQLTPRQPRVICDTVTNVRVTYRDIQETVLLDFHILEAGVRQIRFQLPAWLSDASILAPRTRQKTVTPVEGQPYVEIQLDLQDAITGQYRVVVENDRALAPGRQTAPLPLVDATIINNRYVTLENAGRDEVIVDGTPGMEAIDRESRQWDQLTERLRGGVFATAYVATGPGPESEFGYQTKQRAAVETAGATIGLARTSLVVDASGAYRAAMLLKVDNRTEPYLEIRLPSGAQLWTAHVAGQPVKPARSVGTSLDSLLRIPLIKTAEGDLDYDVVLKYAGKLDDLRFLSAVQFPIIRTENINIELSQVKLFLPKDFHWFDFDGNATQVSGQGDFDADFVAYQTQQVEKLTQIIRGAKGFSQSRAIYNVQKLGEELQAWRSKSSRRATNEQLRANLDSNKRVMEAATQEIEELADQDEQLGDNRDRLNDFYEEQRNVLSRNSVTRLYGNFATPAPSAKPQSGAATKFNSDWFMEKGQSMGVEPTERAGGSKKRDAQTKDAGKARLIDEESYRVQQQAKMPEESNAAQQVFQIQPQANQIEKQEFGRARRQELGTKSELNRAYLDKIRQLDQQQQGQGQQMAGEMTAPAQEPALELQLDSGAITLADGDADQMAEVALGRAGLSSLDFELPERGEAFYFTTPRGEVEITARPVNRELGDRLESLGWLLAMLLALLIATATVKRVIHSRSGRIISVIVLCCAGVVMMAAGYFPVFGAAMFFGSILLAIDWRGRHAQTA